MNWPLPEVSRKIRAAMVLWAVRLPARMSSARSPARMGVPPTHILDRDAFSLPEEMPDPLTPEGRLNPEDASGFTRPAQALGKAPAR